MQFLADHPAERGFDLLARHRLVERPINEVLVAALPDFVLKKDKRDSALRCSAFAVRVGAFVDHVGIRPPGPAKAPPRLLPALLRQRFHLLEPGIAQATQFAQPRKHLRIPALTLEFTQLRRQRMYLPVQ